MIPVPDALARAIEAPCRQVTVRARVDWDRDGDGGALDDISDHVGGLRIERTLVGELPDEVRLVEGTAAAAATMELTRADPTDATRHAAWWYSPTNPASPLAGKTRVGRPAAVDIGFVTEAGPQHVRRFTGSTRTLTADGAARTARLTALDGRERLRAAVKLPVISGNRHGLNASWFVGYLLHRAGIHTTPSPQAPAVYAPMMGSVLPFTLDEALFDPFLSSAGSDRRRPTDTAARNTKPSFIPGPHVLAAAGSARAANDFDSAYFIATFRPGTTVNGGAIECWARGDTAPGVSPDGELLYLRNRANLPDTNHVTEVRAGIDTDYRLVLHYRTWKYFPPPEATVRQFRIHGPTMPRDGAFHFVGVRWNLVAGTVTFNLDGAITTATFDPTGLHKPNDSARFTAYLPVADVAYWASPATNATRPWLHQPGAVPGARIDASRLELEAITDPGPKEAWAWLREIAAAEQATVGFTEAGQFVYAGRERTNTGPATVVQRVLTDTASVVDLRVEQSIDRVRNVVTVPFADVRIAEARRYLHESYAKILVPAGGRAVFWLDWPVPAVEVRDYINTHEQTLPDTAFLSYATFNTAEDGSDPTTTLDQNLVYGRVTWDQRSARVELVNNMNRPVWTVNRNNRPTLRIGGRGVDVGPTVGVTARHPASIAAHGEQPLPPLPASQWVQRETVAQALADAIIADTATVQTALVDLVIVGDPRLQLGDRIRVVDRDGLALDGHYWITSITDEISTDGRYTQRLTARQAAS